MEKRAEPTMMQTMKQENTMPRGVEPVSKTGVQRKTKMYMQDSSKAWVDPSSSTWKWSGFCKIQKKERFFFKYSVEDCKNCSQFLL